MENINFEVWKSLFFAVIRYVLVLFGGLLVKNGIVDQNWVDGWVEPAAISLLGLVFLAIPVIWKWFRARLDKTTLDVALRASGPISQELARTVAKKKIKDGE